MHILSESASLKNITIFEKINYTIEHADHNYSIDKHSKKTIYRKGNPIIKKIILLQAENQYRVQTKRFDIYPSDSPLNDDCHDGNREKDI